jgi:hypothetical protein
LTGESPANAEVGMSFLLNLVGFIVFIAGAASLATICGASQTHVTGAAAALFVVAIAASIASSRAHDPA